MANDESDEEPPANTLGTSLEHAIPIYVSKKINSRIKLAFKNDCLSLVIGAFFIPAVSLIGPTMVDINRERLRFSALLVVFLTMGSFSVLNSILILKEEMIFCGCCRSTLFR